MSLPGMSDFDTGPLDTSTALLQTNTYTNMNDNMDCSVELNMRYSPPNLVRALYLCPTFYMYSR